MQVGHDWGGAVAWALAEDYPSKLTKIVVVNSAQLSVLGQLMRTNFQQLWRTWYICEFPHPLCVYCTCKFIPWRRGHPSLPFISELVPFPGCEAERLDATGQDQIGRERDEEA